MYAVELLPSAAKAIAKLERHVQVRIARRVDRMADDPRANAAKLVGSDDLWRARVGDFRILYRIDDERLVILVIRIAHRREVYRPR